MGTVASRAGFAPAAAGAAILLQCAAARAVLTADSARIYVLGRPLDWTCALRSRFGLPCPTCGMTRSVVLSLHAELRAAWHVAPAGPVVTIGLLATALLLLVLAALERSGPERWETALKSRVRLGALTYAGVSAIVWMGGWAASFVAAWHAR